MTLTSETSAYIHTYTHTGICMHKHIHRYMTENLQFSFIHAFLTYLNYVGHVKRKKCSSCSQRIQVYTEKTNAYEQSQ